MKNKKIFYITNSRMPTDRAHGLQIMSVCSAMADNGANVTLLVPFRKNNLTADPFAYYDIKNNFTIKTIGQIDFLLWEKYIGAAAFWLQLIVFYLNSFFYLLFYKDDFLVYTRDHFGTILSFLGKSLVYECHNIPKSKRHFFFFLAKRADKLVVINENLKEVFLERGFHGQDILVAHDGVDFSKFALDISRQQARQQLGLAKDKRIILYTGHLYKWKGVVVLASAMEFLSGIDCYFVGGGQRELDDLHKQDVEKFSRKNIKIIEQQPHRLIPTWLKAADILILPNSGQEDISRLYTSPIKMFEYMASRRPIIAADLPSLKNILNQENCLFFKADDAKDLADKINILFDDSSLADKLSQQAFNDAGQYSWDKRAKNILDFIRK